MPRRKGRHGPQGGESGDTGVRPDWRWVLAPAAERQLKHLGEGVQRRIIAELDLLAVASPSVDIRKLEGGNEYRLRVGNYRVIYGVDKANKTFVVSKIADRKDSY
jgi:mRNA interferase RelE/StbE